MKKISYTLDRCASRILSFLDGHGFHVWIGNTILCFLFLLVVIIMQQNVEFGLPILCLLILVPPLLGYFLMAVELLIIGIMQLISYTILKPVEVVIWIIKIILYIIIGFGVVFYLYSIFHHENY